MVPNVGRSVVSKSPGGDDGHVSELRRQGQQVRERSGGNFYLGDDQQEGESALGFLVNADLNEVEGAVAVFVRGELWFIKGERLNGEPGFALHDLRKLPGGLLSQFAQ